MEIQYQNTREDFKAYYEVLWRDQRASQRSDYYHAVLWYLAVLGLATYIAVKHDEVFALCVFVVLAGFYLRQNWSFAKRWKAGVESYADVTPESLSNLVLDEVGATERFSGIQLHVPWTNFDDYSVYEERLFINFLKNRSFIIPFRHLSLSQRNELIETLERHNVRKKA